MTKRIKSRVQFEGRGGKGTVDKRVKKSGGGKVDSKHLAQRKRITGKSAGLVDPGVPYAPQHPTENYGGA